MDKSRLASLGAAVALGAAGIAGGFLLAKTLDKQSRGRANSCCHGKAACSHVGNAIHVDSHMAGAHLHSSVPTSPTAELLDEQPTPSHVGATAGAGAAPGEADSLVPVGRAVVAAKGKRRMSKGSMSAGGISPVIVGVAGASGSGKTSIAELIAARLHGGCVLSISSDNYYKTLPPGTDPSNYNFDHPSSIDFDLLASHLEKLKAGEDVDVPHYDFATHRRTGETTHVDAKKTSVIILDGIFVLWAEKVAATCDLTIFCSEDLDVCLVRR
jgi:Phosphoribulokinase / Uridine kinase family